jgi:hypothetical protein
VQFPPELCDYLYVGENAAEQFMLTLLDRKKDMYKAIQLYRDDLTMITDADYSKHNSSNTCYLCGAEFDRTKNGRKVLDHCHRTGVYRGAACSSCNLKECESLGKVNVFFQNSNYDLQAIVKALASPSIQELLHKEESQLRVESIATNSEKFKTFTFGCFTVLDSMAFLKGSLGELIKLLPSHPYIDEVPRRWAVKKDLLLDEVLETVNCKLVFAYEHNWFADFDKPTSDDVNYANTLQSDFAIEVGQKRVRKDDIREKALKEERETKQAIFKVRDALRLQTWGELHNLYLELDVAGLADVMTSFRTVGISRYGLDPFTCMGIPMYALKAFLKMSEVKIGLIQSKEDYQWFESAKRGGMSMARNSIGLANHPGIGAYDKSKPLTWIHYDDANNLYGWAICCKLPVSSPEECNLDTFDLHDVSKWGLAPAYFNEQCETWQGNFGGMMEFDFDYPDQLHDAHSDFPLAP